MDKTREPVAIQTPEQIEKDTISECLNILAILFARTTTIEFLQTDIADIQHHIRALQNIFFGKRYLRLIEPKVQPVKASDFVDTLINEIPRYLPKRTEQQEALLRDFIYFCSQEPESLKTRYNALVEEYPEQKQKYVAKLNAYLSGLYRCNIALTRHDTELLYNFINLWLFDNKETLN